MRKGLEYYFGVSTFFRHAAISTWLIRLETVAICEVDLKVKYSTFLLSVNIRFLLPRKSESMCDDSYVYLLSS